MTTNVSDGMTYAPQGKPAPVVNPGEFRVAAMHLDHGHIHGQCRGLLEAGADIVAVYEPDEKKRAAFIKAFPTAKPVNDAAILEDKSIHLVAAAAIPNLRGPLGCRVMEHGKDYFTDKTPFTTHAQLADARAVVARTKRKYMVYYSERLHVECAMHAGTLIQQGAIGKVIHVEGFGPHRLSAPSRPPWFWRREEFGGILTDIGSHQVEQFLHYTGSTDAKITSARAANHANPDHPEFEDFGDFTVTGNSGASGYHRVDWFTPNGLPTWGDGRTFILGTEGAIELRKYTHVAPPPGVPGGDHLYLVDKKGVHHMALAGKVGFPFFGQLIRDCLHRTETAMTQSHAFLAAQLCLDAQALADRTH